MGDSEIGFAQIKSELSTCTGRSTRVRYHAGVVNEEIVLNTVGCGVAIGPTECDHPTESQSSHTFTNSR